MTPGTTLGSGQCYQSYRCITSALYHNHQNNQEEKQANACWGINSAATLVSHIFPACSSTSFSFPAWDEWAPGWYPEAPPSRAWWGAALLPLGRDVLRLRDALTQWCRADCERQFQPAPASASYAFTNTQTQPQAFINGFQSPASSELAWAGASHSANEGTWEACATMAFALPQLGSDEFSVEPHSSA